MTFQNLLPPTTTKLLRIRDEESTCISATPGPNGNVPITACNAYYNYDPQYAPAVAVAVIFGILTGIHILEAILFKKKYAWVLIMGSLWETLAFTIHSLGAKDQQVIGYSIAWTLLFLLASLWINGFVYMTFARMVQYWHPEQRVVFRARTIARWFVLADVVSFVVQAVGGVMAGPGNDPVFIKRGLDIYTGGSVLQQGFILGFVGLMVLFQRRCNQVEHIGSPDETGPVKRGWKPLLYGLYGVLLFITVRIIFRIVEFARGFGPENPIPFHEEYIYALDCFPMMVALLILAIFHPGRYLVGPDSEFPKVSRKEKKALKMARKEEKKSFKNGGRLGGYLVSETDGSGSEGR